MLLFSWLIGVIWDNRIFPFPPKRISVGRAKNLLEKQIIPRINDELTAGKFSVAEGNRFNDSFHHNSKKLQSAYYRHKRPFVSCDSFCFSTSTSIYRYWMILDQWKNRDCLAFITPELNHLNFPRCAQGARKNYICFAIAISVFANWNFSCIRNSHSSSDPHVSITYALELIFRKTHFRIDWKKSIFRLEVSGAKYSQKFWRSSISSIDFFL